MPKVLVIVPFPMNEHHLEKRKAQLSAVKLSADMSFEFRAVQIAPANYGSEQDALIADVGILQAGVAAEAEGFDAICIDTVSDAGMTQLRSCLSIPVIGAGRHAVLLALTLGERFSFIATTARWRPLYTKLLKELGLENKCASIRSVDLNPDHERLLEGREEEVFPLLLELAFECVEDDRADVIILGSTTMHEAHRYLAARLPVPVINPGPLTYRFAETAIRLRLSHSKHAYPKPLSPRFEMIAALGR